jgi:hypothetical protein
VASKTIAFIISAKDAASAAFKKVGSTSIDALGLISKASSKVWGAFKFGMQAIRTLDSALNVASRAWRAVSGAISDVVSKSLEFRQQGDPMIDFFRDAQREGDLVKARLGDVLLPVIKGVADAFGAATGRLSDWLAENRKMLSLKLIEWLSAVAKWLVSGVGSGLRAVLKGWLVWKQATLALRAGFSELFATLAMGIANATNNLSALARGIGLNDLADGLAGVTDRLVLFSQNLEGSAQTAQDEFTDVTMVFEAMNDKVVELEKSSVSAIDAAGKAAKKVNEVMRAGAKKSTEEQKTDADLRMRLEKQAIDGIMAMQQARYEWQQEIGKKILADHNDQIAAMMPALMRHAEAWQRMNQVIMEATSEAATSVGQTFGENLAGVVAGQVKVEEGFKSMAKSAVDSVLAAVEKIVVARAVEAASGAASSQSSIPYIGPILAVAAATAMFAFVRGLLSFMATGGVVRGGISGRDSVPAMLMPGEIVLNTGEASMFRRLAHSMSQPRPGGNAPGIRGFAGGGMVTSSSSAGGGGINITFAPQVSTLRPPSNVERRRLLLDLARDFEEMVRDGQILRGAMAR